MKTLASAHAFSLALSGPDWPQRLNNWSAFRLIFSMRKHLSR
jgi:hypothetical protein